MVNNLSIQKIHQFSGREYRQYLKKIKLSVGFMDQSRLVSDIKMSVYILQMSKIDYNYNSEGGLQ